MWKTSSGRRASVRVEGVYPTVSRDMIFPALPGRGGGLRAPGPSKADGEVLAIYHDLPEIRGEPIGCWVG
jgi:hypothetical protein